MPRALTALACLLACSLPAAAIVGDAGPAPAGIARSVVTIVGSRGNFCTGTAIARDLVLTVAHCVLPGSDYKIVQYDSARTPLLRDVISVKAHPKFDLRTMLAHRATADVALLKLAAPLAGVEPARLGAAGTISPGDEFTVAGAGVAAAGDDGKSGGTVRGATLIATGRPGNLQIRLVDPTSRGEKPGLGACTGDSGAPVFRSRDGRFALIGVVSWSTGPQNAAGCGGLTGVTPLTLYSGWITATAKSLGNQF